MSRSRALSFVVALALLCQAPLMSAAAFHSACCAKTAEAKHHQKAAAHCHSTEGVAPASSAILQAGTKTDCPLRCCDVSRTAAAALQLSPAGSYYATQITTQPTPAAQIAHTAIFVRSHSERGPPLA